MVKKLFNRWCQINEMKRFIIISIICAVAIFGVICTFENWSLWEAHEESYVGLQQIAYSISENQNLNLKPDETLQNYKVVWDSNGKIRVKLHAHDMAYISITMDENYQIQEMYRDSEGLLYVILLILTLVGLGLFTTEIIYLVYYGVGALCKFIKKLKDEPEEQKDTENQENTEENKPSEKDNN